MKAVVITKFGGLDALDIREMPEPRAQAGEVVVNVHAAALNHLDIWVRKGRPGFEMRFPHIIGSDGAGIVTEIGAGVTGINIGDMVVIDPGVSCGTCEFCRKGEQSLCSKFSIIGAGRSGTFAEKIAVPAANVFPKPEHLDFDGAAALPVDHVTAWRMLVRRAQLAPGESILIHGIGGGAALAGLQFAKMLGAEAIVTSSSDEKLERAARMGADYVIHYQLEDVAQRVMEATGGRGVDVAFDSVGAATMPINVKVLRRGGRAVICGITSGAEMTLDLRAVYWNQLSIIGSTAGSLDDFRSMLRTVEFGQIHPVLDQVVPLEKAVWAMNRMESGEQFGKIVLHIQG